MEDSGSIPRRRPSSRVSVVASTGSRWRSSSPAARVRTFGLQGLDERLSSRLTVLTGGPRDLPARQQTLRETLAWSVNLLRPREAEALAAMAVFAGTFPLDAARAVAAAHDDVMTELVDHHLVQVIDVGGERRFRLLETVREYAYELLGARRERAEAALVDWIIEVLAGTDLDMLHATQVEMLGRLDAALDSLRDTLRHAARDPDPTRELAISSGVWRYWLIRGHLTEGLAILEGTRASRAGGRTGWRPHGSWSRVARVQRRRPRACVNPLGGSASRGSAGRRPGRGGPRLQPRGRGGERA